MRFSQSFSGATAVTKGHYGDYFLAINHAILLIDKKGNESTLLKLENRILDLKISGNVIYGVGDLGTFIRSDDYGVSWEQSTLPTTSSIWSVCSDDLGTVVTHGNNILFLSKDYGKSWDTFHPFQEIPGSKPSIRSILLDGQFIYVGTKVHPVYGGVWRIDLDRYELVRVKKDTRMIASILKHKQFLVTATGTCKGYGGGIDYCHTNKLYQKNCEWESCESECKERCYLDLSEGDGFLYTTSSQDESGIGKVSRVYLDEKRVVPCALIHGHGWRISNQRNEFLVAGLHESLYSHSPSQYLIQQ